MGSALLFLMPCVVLAILSPYMIRLATPTLAQVGRSSGFIIAASTIGSIAPQPAHLLHTRRNRQSIIRRKVPAVIAAGSGHH